MAKKKRNKKKTQKKQKKMMVLATLAAAFVLVLLGLIPVDDLDGLPAMFDDPHGVFGEGESGFFSGLLTGDGSHENSETQSAGGSSEGEAAGDSGAGLAAGGGESQPDSNLSQGSQGDEMDVPGGEGSAAGGHTEESGIGNEGDGSSSGSNGSLVFEEGVRVDFDCPVVRVVDGDTMIITIDGVDERVRLIGVDTPESVHPTAEKNVPYGEVASAFAKDFLADKTVTVEFDVQERDRYSRILAYIYVDGKMFNETLLEEGHAQIATYPPNVKYVERFQALQDAAKEAKVGMWAEDLEDLLWY